MNLVEILSGVAKHLIEIMAVVLFVALFLRYIAYRLCAQTQTYVKSLSRNVEKHLGKVPGKDIIGKWMQELFEAVEKEMPNRGLRFRDHKKARDRFADSSKQTDIKDFILVKRSLPYNICQNADALRNPSHPPDFLELGNRVLVLDPYWNKLFGFLPVATLQRVLAMLPGLYIIGGIFGTFIGITAALPMIADIDLGNLEASGPVLNAFVGNIAYSMNTSIAGIIFSVILTLLNTVFPLETVRNDVEENVATIFENLWNHIHKEKMGHGEREIISKLQELIELTKGQQTVSASSPVKKAVSKW